jgi:hypothetical protein
MPKSPDDLPALAAERAAADREYNEALTRLDRAIQQLPANFPRPPGAPDEHQITPLNTLWKLNLPSGGITGSIFSLAHRISALFEQQQTFNAALVEHLNRNVPVARDTRESIDGTIAVLHDTIADLARFQSLLVVFLQQITPYVDTRDRDVAGLLRGLSGAINAVADEVLKRAEAASVRDSRHEQRVASLEASVAALREELAALRRRAGEHG